MSWTGYAWAFNNGGLGVGFLICGLRMRPSLTLYIPLPGVYPTLCHNSAHRLAAHSFVTRTGCTAISPAISTGWCSTCR